MRYRNFRGHVSYRHDTQGEVGREWFGVSVQRDGTRTLRAHCEMDDEQLLRDVTYTVDGAWRPLDAFVRLVVNGRFQGSSWFRFHAGGAECEGLTATEGRVRQSVALPRWPTLFAPHPVTTDAWQASVIDYSCGPGRHRLECCTNSSSRPDGGSGPMLGVVYKDLEYVGDEDIEVAAGRFRVRHVRIHPVMGAMASWPPLELWVAGEDFLLTRLRWDLLSTTYELTQIDGDFR